MTESSCIDAEIFKQLEILESTILTNIAKDELILSMTSEKQEKTSELSKNYFLDPTPARNKAQMKMTYPVNYESATKSVVIINICMLL